MKGDFTRDSFDPARRFRRVLMQQGRVQIDADFNEQASIILRYLQSLGTDIVGRFGGPSKVIGSNGNTWEDNDAFAIASQNAKSFNIGAGHYYVDGILVENLEPATYVTQPDFTPPGDANLPDRFVVYLEVFERSILAPQDIPNQDDPIAEPALEGLDTAARSRVVWQVKVFTNTDGLNWPSSANDLDESVWASWLDRISPAQRGQLKARARSTVTADTLPCVVPPASSFRGQDNQLYRVEIHQSGTVGQATFKWSRENGSVMFPVTAATETTVTLANLGRDARFGLKPGDWVELTDDFVELSAADASVKPLAQVDSIDVDNRLVVLKPAPDAPDKTHFLPQIDLAKHPVLRRWEAASRLFVEHFQDDQFDDLENGVQIQFQTVGEGTVQHYRRGDYWLIPARVVLGDILWPGAPDSPEALGPRGIDRHFAPLASFNGQAFNNLRRLFDHLKMP